MKKLRHLAFGFGALLGVAALTIAAHAAGVWSTLPIVGGQSYCASTVTGTGGLGGITGTGQGTVGSICGQTVPAGPPVFTGTEYAPIDLFTPGTNNQNGGPATAQLSITQLGQGPMVDLTTVAVANTIPNNTPFYFVDGAQGSAFTVTMPAVAIEGQFQRIVCTSATAGAMTIAPNTGQTLKPAPAAAACVAGTPYTFRYQASSSSWFRIGS